MHRGHVLSLALGAFALVELSPAQRVLVAEPENRQVHLYDLTAGVIRDRTYDTLALGIFTEPKGAIRMGAEVWIYGGDEIHRLDEVTGALLGTLQPGFGPIQTVASRPGGGYLVATQVFGGEVRFYDANDTLEFSVFQRVWDIVPFGAGFLVVDDVIDAVVQTDESLSPTQLVAALPDPTVVAFWEPESVAPLSNGGFIVTSVIRQVEFDGAGNLVGEYETGQFERGAVEMGDGRLMSPNLRGMGVYDTVTDEFFDLVPGTIEVEHGDVAPFDGGSPDVRNVCTGLPNSTGASASLSLYGSRLASAPGLFAEVRGLPTDQFGIFVLGPPSAPTAFGNGLLCLSTGTPPIVRLGDIVSTGSTGTLRSRLDYADVPLTNAIVPGASWGFQFLHRDAGSGGLEFNASSAIAITFD